MNPEVAIVIVNWNKKDYVLNLLRSLEAIDYDNHEVIVVDNASTDNSVEAIKKTFPDVTLLVNKENLGGTGGFNTGMKYALHNTDCKYIWLLDNDAEVERHTLIELVKAMEADPDIGIAGSRIMSPENRTLLVELGGFVDWKAVKWKPNQRYTSEHDYKGKNIVEVDYVAACSAIVRRDTLEKVGIMDERFFIHWDDIDFCLRIKKEGYKVVAVFKSKVYHSVEKGFNPLLLYYDFRNGFLMISKHLKGLKKLISFIVLLRILFEMQTYFLFERNLFASKLLFYALIDFCSNKYGRLKKSASKGSGNMQSGYENMADTIKNAKNIIVFSDGPYEELKEAVLQARSLNSHGKISLLLSKDRVSFFKNVPVDKIIFFDEYNYYYFKRIILFFKLLFSNYTIGVTTNKLFNQPYVYCIKRNTVYDPKTKKFQVSQKNIYKIWKIPFVFLLSNITTCLTGLFIFIFTYRHK